MNRGLLLLLAPALLVALLYWGLGYRMGWRGITGGLIFLAALVYALRRQAIQRQKRSPGS
jgi:hypothetical protein